MVDSSGMVIYANPPFYELCAIHTGNLTSVQRFLNRQSGFKPALQYLETTADTTAWLRIGTSEDSKEWLLLQAVRDPDSAKLQQVLMMSAPGLAPADENVLGAYDSVKDNEERMRLSLDAAECATWDWNIQNGRVFWSDRLYECFGIKPGSFGGTVPDFYAQVHPEDLTLVQEAVQKALSHRKTHQLEYRIVRPSGEVRWIATRGQAHYDETGKPIRMLGVAVDITERREARDLLIASEERLRLLMDSLPALIAYVDSTLCYRFNNRTYLDWFGLAPEEIVGKNIADAFGEDFYREHLQYYERVLKGETVRYESSLHKQDGDEIQAEVLLVPDNRDDEVIGFYLLGTDITIRRESERALRESEEKLRTLAEALPQIVWTSRPDGFQDYANKRWMDYTGLSLHDARVGGWQRSIHPDDLDDAMSRWNMALRSGQVFETEFRLRRGADNSYRWFLARAVPLRDYNGHIMWWLGTCTDIDEQVKASEAVRQANEHLAMARDRALEANRTKDQFLANMSHELRTPLTAIIGYAEMLMEEAEEFSNEESRRDLQNITSAGRHLLSLISDILDLSKIEAGRMEVSLAPVDIRSLVDAVAFTVGPIAVQNQNDLVVDCPQDIGIVLTDEMKVRQILVNLLGNANKFTEKGMVGMQVKHQEELLVFEISDTGIGIAEWDLERLFQEFVQLDASPTRRHSGTGLGLAITRRFCEMLGGTIYAESKIGEGSVFTVRLPFVPLEAEAVSRFAEDRDEQ